jgi:TolB-like protein/Tfp pilus assembly protein PilF
MYDLGEEAGIHFITMEYVAGEDLKSLMNRIGILPVSKSLAIAREICQGLAEAHSLGVVHRDLKPQNIMIDKDGHAHIMDFGIARSISSSGITTSGVMIGTPGYMAPEQLEGKRADQRSDIYAFGAILYEMLTHRRPFEGDTAIAIALKQKSDDPPDPRRLNSQIDENLGGLIQACLKADPDGRIQNTEELLLALQSIEYQEIDSEKKRLSETSRPQTSMKPAYFRLIIGAVSVLAVVIVGYFTITRLLPTREKAAIAASATKLWEDSIAVLPFRDQSPQKDQDHICTGLTLAINNRLTQLGDLKVISLSAVMRFKDREEGIKQVGRDLDVDHILDGTILREGNKIRIMGELIDVRSGANLWSEAYEGDLENIFEVYDNVSQKVAEAMKLELAPDAVMTLKSDRPENMEAYEFYLKAMTYLNSRYIMSRDEKDFTTAVQMFNRALELDPKYTLAYAGLAWAYQHHYIFTNDPKYFVQVAKYMETAYKLDPEEPLALACKSWVDFAKNDVEQAFESLRKALAINPNLAELNFGIGVICRFSGLSQLAVKYLARAHELDPFYLYSLVGYAANQFFIGELDKASPWFEKVYAMGPDDPIVAEFYSAFCVMHGEHARALNILNRWEKNYPDSPEISDLRAYLYAATGEKETALQNSPQTYWFAYVYAELGMKHEAVEYIKKYLHRQIYLPYLKLVNQPVFDKIRGDPGFREIVAIQKKAYEERMQWALGF